MHIILFFIFVERCWTRLFCSLLQPVNYFFTHDAGTIIWVWIPKWSVVIVEAGNNRLCGGKTRDTLCSSATPHPLCFWNWMGRILWIMDNVSVIRVFSLSGINETMNYRIAIFSLTLLFYCVILFVNIALILIIILDENLHEPMFYCAVFALMDFMGQQVSTPSSSSTCCRLLMKSHMKHVSCRLLSCTLSLAVRCPL